MWLTRGSSTSTSHVAGIVGRRTRPVTAREAIPWSPRQLRETRLGWEMGPDASWCLPGLAHTKMLHHWSPDRAGAGTGRRDTL